MPGGEASDPVRARPIDLSICRARPWATAISSATCSACSPSRRRRCASRSADAAIKERLFLAHALKGSARGVGAFAIAECACAIENSPTDRLVVKRLVRLIDEACDFIASISR